MCNGKRVTSSRIEQAVNPYFKWRGGQLRESVIIYGVCTFKRCLPLFEFSAKTNSCQLEEQENFVKKTQPPQVPLTSSISVRQF